MLLEPECSKNWGVTSCSSESELITAGVLSMCRSLPYAEDPFPFFYSSRWAHLQNDYRPTGERVVGGFRWSELRAFSSVGLGEWFLTEFLDDGPLSCSPWFVSRSGTPERGGMSTARGALPFQRPP